MSASSRTSSKGVSGISDSKRKFWLFDEHRPNFGREMKQRSSVEYGASEMSYQCRLQLDQRPDQALVKVYETACAAIQQLVAIVSHLKCDNRGRPDAVQLWVLYIATLTFGSAQAALVLVLHNLQRESLAFQRIVLEIIGRAYFYRNHPRIARLEINAEPFREIELLNRLKYDRRKKRYRVVKLACQEIRSRNPGINKFVKTRRTFKQMMWRRKGKRQNFLYSFHYEVNSRLSHASILGMRDVVKVKNGLTVDFDSRLMSPDFTIYYIAQYLVVFLKLLDEVFDLKNAQPIQLLKDELDASQNELIARMEAARRGKQ